MIYHLTLDVKQFGDLEMAVPPVLFGQPYQRQPQSIIVLGPGWYCRELRSNPITRHIRRSDVANFCRV